MQQSGLNGTSVNSTLSSEPVVISQVVTAVSAIIANRQDELSTEAAAAVMHVVDAVVGSSQESASGAASNSTGSAGTSPPLAASSVALSEQLLAIVARVNVHVAHWTHWRRRLQQDTARRATSTASGSTTSSSVAVGTVPSTWAHDTADKIARGLADTLVPGSPSVSLTAGSVSDNSQLSVRGLVTDIRHAGHLMPVFSWCCLFALHLSRRLSSWQ